MCDLAAESDPRHEALGVRQQRISSVIMRRARIKSFETSIVLPCLSLPMILHLSNQQLSINDQTLARLRLSYEDKGEL